MTLKYEKLKQAYATISEISKAKYIADFEACKDGFKAVCQEHYIDMDDRVNPWISLSKYQITDI